MYRSIIAIFAFVCVVRGQDEPANCTTPTEVEGRCVSIDECTKLKSLITSDREFLKKWHCGFDNDIPRVCCPPLPKICTTLEGTNGLCVSLPSCPRLTKKLLEPASKENIAYVQRSRCLASTRYDVCCDRKDIVGIDYEILKQIFDDTKKEPFIIVDPHGTSTNSPTTKADDLIDKSIGGKTTCVTTALPREVNSKCCGIDSTSGNKIIGGKETAIDAYPWLVLIEYTGRDESNLCGGTLISGRYVLTAAHCLVGPLRKEREVKSVRLGEFNTTNEGKDCVFVDGGGKDCTDGAISIAIEAIVVHPEYNKFIGVVESNDIALIRLKEMAPYTEFIRPICLPESDVTADPPMDVRFWVAGWGAVSETIPLSAIKLQVDLPLVNHEACSTQYSIRGKSILWEKQLCAGGISGKDTCQGDSGGPIIYAREKYQEIVGVTSFGVKQCGSNGKPSVYSKVYEYLPWIRSSMRS